MLLRLNVGSYDSLKLILDTLATVYMTEMLFLMKSQQTYLFCVVVVFVLLPPASTASGNCEHKQASFYLYSVDLQFV